MMYTPEQLQVWIERAVLEDSELTFEKLCTNIFKNELPKDVEPLCNLIKKIFLENLKTATRVAGKSFLSKEIHGNNDKFVQDAEIKRVKDKFIEIFPENIQQRLRVLKAMRNERSTMAELCNTFLRLREGVFPRKNEELFCKEISEWVKDGKATKELFHTVRQWSKDFILEEFKKRKNWPEPASNDLGWHRLCKVADEIQGNTFRDRELIQRTTTHLFQKPTLKVNYSVITLKGRTIYLSDWFPHITAILTPDKTLIKISAEYSFHIDIDKIHWPGINIGITAKKIYVWSDVVIDVSGKGYESEHRKAESSKDVKMPGKNGRDGHPGESAGNVTILTWEFTNSELLTIKANGGRGENGENGGDGCDGIDGHGVEKDELLKIGNGIQGDYWVIIKHMNYRPSGWPTIDKDFCSINPFTSYVRKELRDDKGRRLIYNFSQFFGLLGGINDMYCIIKGANGVPGSAGGVNGDGGEGGYAGVIHVAHPDKRVIYSVKTENLQGRSGKNGQSGRDGRIGINGNDMAVMNRTSSEPIYFGDDRPLRLNFEYSSNDEGYTQYDAYERYENHRNDYYVGFKTTDIGQIERTVFKNVTKTTQTNASKAVGKESILNDELMNDTEQWCQEETMFDVEIDSAYEKMEVVEQTEEQRVTEQTTIVLQRSSDLDYFMPLKANKTQAYTPKAFVEHVKSLGFSPNTDQVIDVLTNYKSLELESDDLNEISANIVQCQKIFEREGKFDEKSSKTMKDIKELFAKYRTEEKEKLSDLYYETNVHVPEIKLFDSIICGVKKDDIPDGLKEWLDSEKVRQLVWEFFRPSAVLAIQSEHMSYIRTFITSAQNLDKLTSNLNLFNRVELDWCDQGRANAAFKLLADKVLKNESVSLRQTVDSDDELAEEVVPGEYPWEIIEKSTDELQHLEDQFLKVVEILSKNRAEIGKLFKPIKNIADRDPKFETRFGKMPNFTTRTGILSFFGKKRNVANAIKLIHLWCLFNRANTFNDILCKLQQYEPELIEVNTSIDCSKLEKHLRNLGLKSSGFRYLLYRLKGISIVAYKSHGYKTIKQSKFYTVDTENQHAIWLKDNGTEISDIYGIASDLDFQKLIAVQDQYLKDTSLLRNLMNILPKASFTTDSEMKKIAEFFEPDFHQLVIEAVNAHIVLLDDSRLLNVLYWRFAADGCHLSLLELQFILESASLLVNYYKVSLDLILLIVLAYTQDKFIDKILQMRMRYFNQKIFKDEDKLDLAISVIQSSRLKVLYAVKLHDHLKHGGDPVEEEMLFKMVLMLQQITSNIQSLANDPLTKWIELAKEHTFSEIETLLKEFGSVGYYLAILDAKGLTMERRIMRHALEKQNIVLEKYIGVITYYIINHEVKADKEFFKYYIELFKPLQKPEETPRELITDEKQQIDLWNSLAKSWSKNPDRAKELLEKLFPSGERTLKQVEELISGLFDVGETEEETTKKIDARNKKTKNICNLISSEGKDKFPEKSKKYVELLMEYDEALYNEKNIKLRPTQKVAIMYALETEQTLLEQVNTGEGKTYIIAGIACIRARTGYKFIDVITSSPVLAKRDAEALKPLYKRMQVTVSHNCDENPEERKKAYTAQVVYGHMTAFQRDYLLQTFYKKMILGNRIRDAVIVDEVDNMLLDNGNNMLYLSHSVPGMNLIDSLLIFIQELVFAPMYGGETDLIEEVRARFDSKQIRKTVLEDLFGFFSEDDLSKVLLSHSKEKIAILYAALKDKVIDQEGCFLASDVSGLDIINELWLEESVEIIDSVKSCLQMILKRHQMISLPNYLRPYVKIHLNKLIENCKNAFFMKPNTEYVVDVDRTGMVSSLEPMITIIDSNTGADLPSSQWNEGLHQFLQLKHGCRLSSITLKAVFISNVAYLKGYNKINGLSGTLGSLNESRTLSELYDADLIKIPPAKPKKFCEHVPVMATERTAWIKNIYDEVCDQALANRSVLVVCEDIAQLDVVVSGITSIFKQEDKPNEAIEECFENLIAYRREHDKFPYESKSLPPHRVVVATNLASRGMDILLSPEVLNAGGLHVIVAYLPRNCRIEEQAYGRAGRCGYPGSAQIIGLQTESENSNIQPSIFMLKTLRDNAEVTRLRHLKSYYEYYTDIEEQCLEKFRGKSDLMLGVVANRSRNADYLPSKKEIHYFALLDQWAFWLDSQQSAIEDCSKKQQPDIKQKIIDRVDEFIEKYKCDTHNSFMKWTIAPQIWLNLGALYIRKKTKIDYADALFNQVIIKEPEFAAEAHYFRGVLRAIEFEKNGIKVTQDRNKLEDAIGHFHKSRTHYELRIQRKEHESVLVGKLITANGQNNMENSGFLAQTKIFVENIQLIVSNIDFWIGTPCDEETFVQDGIDIETSKNIYQKVVQQKIISPITVTSSKLELWQLNALSYKFKLSHKQISKAIKKLKNSPKEMEAMGSFYDICEVLAVNLEAKAKLPSFFNKLEPINLNNEEKGLLLTRFSNSLSLTDELYDWKYIQDYIALDEEKKDQVSRLITQGTTTLDKLAKINLLKLKEFKHFEKYDGVTVKDITDYFQMNENYAQWILDQLADKDVLQKETLEFWKFDKKHEAWKQNNDEMLEKYPNLRNLAINSTILNITEKICAHYSNLVAGSEESNELYQYLINQKLIVSYEYSIYRQKSKMNFDFLPSCIVPQLEDYFSDRFAFAFALGNLVQAIDKHKSTEPAIFQVFLSEKSYSKFENALLVYGILEPSRIHIKRLKLFNPSTYPKGKKIIDYLYNHCRKLHRKTNLNANLKSFGKYVEEKVYFLEADIWNMIDNGMVMVLAVPKNLSELSELTKSVESKITLIEEITLQYAPRSTAMFGEYADTFFTTIHAVIEAGELAVTGINKGTEIVEKVSNSTTEELEFPNEVQFIIDKVSSIISTVSRYVTATIDNYEYYHQARVISSRVARNHGYNISEYTILRAYHENRIEQKEEEKVIEEKNEEAETKIELGRSQLIEFCQAVLKKNSYFMRKNVTIRNLERHFEHSRAVDTFKGELRDALALQLWGFHLKLVENTSVKSTLDIQIADYEKVLLYAIAEFYKYVNEACDLEEPNEDNSNDVTKLKTEEVVKEVNAILEEDIEAIANMKIEEVKTLISSQHPPGEDTDSDFDLNPAPSGNIASDNTSIDSGSNFSLNENALCPDTNKESDANNPKNESIVADLFGSVIGNIVKPENFKQEKEKLSKYESENPEADQKVEQLFNNLFIELVEVEFVYPAKQHLYAWISSIIPSSFIESNKSDESLKSQVHQEFLSNQAQVKTIFLTEELVSLIHSAMMECGISKKPLHHAIRFGYPLPTDQLVIAQIGNLLEAAIANVQASVDGFQIKVVKNNQKQLFYTARTSSINWVIILQPYNNTVYLSQHDFRAFTNLNDTKTQITPFIYEELVKSKPELGVKFINHDETLRECFINNLNSSA
ncbi:hypothetical protein FO519_008983 [Halicephalobus sp. NKZ332]|nr:hypothetical protein FO519_008983 [Halicephalobus sp. NKZ332]